MCISGVVIDVSCVVLQAMGKQQRELSVAAADREYKTAEERKREARKAAEKDPTAGAKASAEAEANVHVVSAKMSAIRQKLNAIVSSPADAETFV